MLVTIGGVKSDVWTNPFAGQVMTDNGDGTFSITANVPAGRHEIAVVDPWMCSGDVQICAVSSGRGLTVNTVRLKDGEFSTTFGLTLPTTITP
jgi:hypothetical protein